MFLHVRRSIYKPMLSLTETHLEAFRLLISLSTCAYSVVRIPAQRVLDSCFSTYARSYLFVIDDITSFIRRESKATHEQFKGKRAQRYCSTAVGVLVMHTSLTVLSGALYLLQFGKARSVMLRQNWPTLLKIWPAIVNAQYSEKPSIVTLLDTIHDLVVSLFASFEIRFTVRGRAIRPVGYRRFAASRQCASCSRATA